MVINIFSQRKAEDYETGKISFPFFSEKVSFTSIEYIFKNIKEVVEHFPESERWNLHYTLAHCDPNTRIFGAQDVIPFDIDKIDLSVDIQKYHDVFFRMTGLDPVKTGIVESGHGIHYIVKPEGIVFSSQEELQKYKIRYLLVCRLLEREYAKLSLRAKVDDKIFSVSHLLRLPNTMNVKDGYEPVKAVLTNSDVITQVFDADAILGVTVKDEDVIQSKVADSYPTPDTEAVQKECLFLDYAKNHPNELDEPQWYTMLSVVSRLEDGRELCHEYSKGHDNYDREETDAKIDHAKEFGPAKCSRIATLYADCKQCTHCDKIKSPIVIKGETYIKTKDQGFHNYVWNKDHTQITKKIPVVEDMRLFWERETSYISMDEGGLTFAYNGKHWETRSPVQIEGFAYTHFSPKVTNGNVLGLFKTAVRCTNLTKEDFFTQNTIGVINFQNGVLNTRTGQLVEHSKSFGFTSVLDIEYDEDAECPRFHQFMEEVMPDEESIKMAWEFIGWTLSGDHPKKFEKFLILLGGGSNGKSVFIDTISRLMGNSCTHMSMDILSKDNLRLDLQKSLLNVNTETENTTFRNKTGLLKQLTSGEKITARLMGKNGMDITPRAKFVFSCNSMPSMNDLSGGLNRRMMILPFKKQFYGEEKDVNLPTKLLAELAGIARYAITCYKQLEKRGGFIVPGASKNEAAGYFGASCEEMDFMIDAATYDDKEAFTSSREIHQAYSNWSLETGYTPKSQTYLTRRLKPFLATKGIVCKLHKINNKVIRGYKGLTLVEVEEVISVF